MSEWFYHKTGFDLTYFGIRYSKWDFFALFSFSLYEIDIRIPSKKFSPKIRFIFHTLCLPTAQTRYEAQRKY